MNRIALNVCDLSELAGKDPFPVQLLLKDFIVEPRDLVNLGEKHNIDEGAVILNGPAAQDEKRLDGLVQLLQTHLGPKKLGRRFRCYREGKRGAWPEIIPSKKKEPANAP